jgi:hypothetical protein
VDIAVGEAVAAIMEKEEAYKNNIANKVQVPLVAIMIHN